MGVFGNLDYRGFASGFGGATAVTGERNSAKRGNAARLPHEYAQGRRHEYGAFQYRWHSGEFSTDLPYHYCNPFPKGDLLSEIVNRLHSERVRVMAIFDFSKISEIPSANS
jgi:hypothetical protein